MFYIFMTAFIAFISCLILNEPAYAIAALIVMALTFISAREPE